MSRTIHPSELAQILQNRFIAKSAAVSILILSLILLAGGTRSQFPESRMWLFGSSLACAFLSRQIHRIAIDAERQFDDSKDISLTNWQNQLFKRTRSEELTLQIETPPPAAERLPLFDWTELADSDQHPVLAIIAPMGGGKSRLVKWLGKYVLFDTHPQIVAFDIYARRQDWENAATEYSEMLEVMRQDLKEIDDRKNRYRNGESEFSPQLRVLEEAVDTLPSIKALNQEADSIVDSWLRVHVSVARKLKYRLCLVSVKLRGSDIGIGSESRDDATVIFVGQKGVSKAMSDTRYFKLGTKQNVELKEQLRLSLSGIQHPALICSNGEWYPASVPSLSATGDPIGMMQTAIADEPEELEDDDLSDTLDKIEALAIKLQSENQNCTPGKVRKFVHDCKGNSDAEIIRLFQILETENRGTIGASGKAAKFCPNAEISHV